MQFVFTAPHLNAPTYETFVSYAEKKMSKLSRFLKKSNDFEHEVKISADKAGDIFEVRAETFIPEAIFVKAKHRDLRRALDMLKDKMIKKTKNTLDRKKGR